MACLVHLPNVTAHGRISQQRFLKSRVRPYPVLSGSLATGTGAQTDAVVDRLLSMVKNSDRGAALGKEQQTEVGQLVSQLEQLNIPAEPLNSPLIFGEWDVDYCSNPTAPGGYYRSALGRVFFQTKEMVQTITEPDYVGNRVAFAAFGLLDGEVSLAGKLTPLDSRSIEIEFEPPLLKLGSLSFQYGATSRVQIAVLYVDERIRLGRGSRGSIFVFRRRHQRI